MAARLVSSGIGVPWLLVAAAPCGGVRILSDRPVPVSSSQVAPTTSIPMPSPRRATTGFTLQPLDVARLTAGGALGHRVGELHVAHAVLEVGVRDLLAAADRVHELL